AGAAATKRASGFRPRSFAFPSDISTSAVAPSFSGDAFPAVTEPLSPNAGFSLASASKDVAGRGPSSSAIASTGTIPAATGLDLACGRDGRLHARAAEPVDGLAGHLDREPGEEQGHPRHVAVVFSGLVRAAEDHVFHVLRLDVGALADLLEDDRREVVGPDVLELPAIAPHRRAGGGNDDRVSPPHLWGGGGAAAGGAARRGRVLPIHGEVARSAG